jgi:hypothetical protein
VRHVDGSKNPDQIPESAAYRLVFLSLKPPDPTNQTAVAGRAATLRKIGLSAADLAILGQQLVTFAADYKALQTQIVSAATDPASLHAQVATLVLVTRNALLGQLSPDGAAKFSAYVQNAKGRMIVRP